MLLLMSQLRTILGRRCGPWIALADLDDAVGFALRVQGLSVADISAVADADLAPVASTDVNQLLDVAEWRAFESILNGLSEEQLKAIGIVEDLDKIEMRLRRRVDAMWARIKQAYGVGLPTLEAGVGDFGINQRDFAGTFSATVTCGSSGLDGGSASSGGTAPIDGGTP